MKIAVIVCFMVITIYQAYSQKDIINLQDVDSIPEIEEVKIFGYSNIKLDTVGLHISYVLEMVRTNPNPGQVGSCDINDFIVMYDNHSCVYFSMGCAWSCMKLYWTEKNETTLFYSGENIENEIKRYKSDMIQIANFISENGQRIHIGSKKYGFDYLVGNPQNYCTPFSYSGIVDNYIFRKEENIRECHQTYYNSIIKEK